MWGKQSFLNHSINQKRFINSGNFLIFFYCLHFNWNTWVITRAMFTHEWSWITDHEMSWNTWSILKDPQSSKHTHADQLVQFLSTHLSSLSSIYFRKPERVPLFRFPWCSSELVNRTGSSTPRPGRIFAETALCWWPAERHPPRVWGKNYPLRTPHLWLLRSTCSFVYLRLHHLMTHLGSKSIILPLTQVHPNPFCP